MLQLIQTNAPITTDTYYQQTHSAVRACKETQTSNTMNIMSAPTSNATGEAFTECDDAKTRFYTGLPR